MKKTDDNKNHFEKKNLVKLAPAVVVIAAVAAAGARNMDAKTSQTADEKSIVKSIEVENWLKTAYTYEEEEEILKNNENQSSSSKKKKSQTTLPRLCL